LVMICFVLFHALNLGGRPDPRDPKIAHLTLAPFGV